MKMLVVYDNEGVIIAQYSGEVRQPIGVPIIVVDIPQGQTVQRIDTSVEPHTPVYAEIPRPQIELEVETLKANNERLEALLADLAEVVLMGV